MAITTQTSRFVTDDLLVSSLAPLTVFLFGALQMYFQNAQEFPWILLPVTVTLALLSLMVTLVIFVLLRAARRMPLLHQGLTVVVTAVGVMLWIQGNFFVRQYGIFDGEAIDWNHFARYAPIDLALWAGGIVFMLALMRWTYRYAPRLAQVVLLIQLVSTVLMAFTYEAPEFLRYEEDASRKFAFSKNSNVIFFVLDTFATDFFQEGVLPSPKYRAVLDGFTYYPDTLSQYPTTYPVPTAILTGEHYLNQQPFQAFMKDAYTSEKSLPLRLKQAGYDVYLPHANYTYASPETSSSIIMAELPLAYPPEELRPLLLASAFRYAPHPLKKRIFIAMQNALSTTPDDMPYDLRFLEEFRAQARVEAMAGTMKYYHLWGMHPPYRIDEDLQAAVLPQSRAGILRAARGNAALVEEFIEILNNLGVYDNSLVFVLADHGSMLPEKPHGFSVGSMAYLNPLLLIKPPGERGPLRISSRAATLSDLPATVMDVLDGSVSGMSGISLLRNSDSQNGQRYYYSYYWDTEHGWDKAFLPGITEYRITGSSLEEEHWERTGTVYAPGKTLQHVPDPLEGPPLYNVDTFLNFSRLTVRRSMLLSGWGTPGMLELYPQQRNAELLLRITDVPTEYLAFSADFSPVSLHREQRVILRTNGNEVAQWIIRENRQKVRALLHESVLGGSVDTVFSFEFPDAFDAAMEMPDHEQLSGEVSVVLHRMKLSRMEI